jgi:hypothetical protein
MTSAKGWPRTEGTIESAQMEFVNSYSEEGVRLPVFAFSYRVEGGYYSGRFSLLPYVTDPAEGFMERLIGSKVTVQYSPQHPEQWFVADELIEGCKIQQKRGLGFFAPKD